MGQEATIDSANDAKRTRPDWANTGTGGNVGRGSQRWQRWCKAFAMCNLKKCNLTKTWNRLTPFASLEVTFQNVNLLQYKLMSLMQKTVHIEVWIEAIGLAKSKGLTLLSVPQFQVWPPSVRFNALWSPQPLQDSDMMRAVDSNGYNWAPGHPESFFFKQNGVGNPKKIRRCRWFTGKTLCSLKIELVDLLRFLWW